MVVDDLGGGGGGLVVEEDVGVEEAGAADYELVEEGQDGGGIVGGDEGGRERVELRSGVGEARTCVAVEGTSLKQMKTFEDTLLWKTRM